MRNARFIKGLDLSLANISGTGRLNFFDLDLNDYKTIYTPETFEGKEKVIANKKDITEINKRETFRIIKNSLIADNNTIDSLKLKKLELDTYRNEVFNDDSFSGISNTLSLFLHRMSNNFDSNWIVGFVITISASVYFFTLFLFTVDTPLFEFGWESHESFISASNEVL